MKILVISNYRGLHVARPEAEIFIGLSLLGYDITIMTYADAEYIPRLKENGIQIIPRHPSKKNDPVFTSFLKNHLTENKYDILHLFNNKAILSGIRAAKNIDIKVVIYRGAAANMAWYNPLNYLKFFHPRIDYVVCNSEEVRQKFLSVPYYNPDKAVTILKGHDSKWYSGVTKHDIRQELGIKKEAFLFIIVANNRKVKGVHILLKAMKCILKDANIELIVVGEKMDRSPIPKLTKKSGKSDKIHFLGYREDVLNIVAACDSLINPSTGSEALSKCIVEAMSLGIVPIVSDIKGNIQLVDDKINGLIFRNRNYVELSEKMLYLYNNQELMSDLSMAAKQKIEQDINHEDTVQAYDDFYKKIVS